MKKTAEAIVVREVRLNAEPGYIHGSVLFAISTQRLPHGAKVSLHEIQAAFTETLVNLLEGKK